MQIFGDTMAYWILKTEPNAYSFEQLKKDKTTDWDGVRNYQARNNLKLMRVNDEAMIYHSIGPKSIVGIATVIKESFKDKTIDTGDWVAVGIKFKEYLPKEVSLKRLKENPLLKDLSLIKQGRLSVCPVTKTQWEEILKMAQ